MVSGAYIYFLPKTIKPPPLHGGGSFHFEPGTYRHHQTQPAHAAILIFHLPHTHAHRSITAPPSGWAEGPHILI
jgi:hypothetical protein